jgi:MFS family permease
MTVVANWFDRSRTRALSALTFMGAFSSTLTYPIAGALIAHAGWRECVAILGVVQLLVTLPLHALVVRRHPEDVGLFPDGAREAGPSTPLSGIPFRTALRSAAFWLPTIAISLAYFASTAVLLEHVAYLIRGGYAPTFASAIVGLFGLAYLPGRWLVAWAADRVGLTSLFAATFAIEALGIALLAFVPALPGVVAYVCTFGAAYGATSPLRGALMGQRFGRRAYGAILAAQGVPVGIVAALGPVVTGRLIDTLGYRAAFAGCIAALLLAAAIVSRPAGRTEASGGARGLASPVP